MTIGIIEASSKLHIVAPVKKCLLVLVLGFLFSAINASAERILFVLNEDKIVQFEIAGLLGEGGMGKVFLILGDGGSNVRALKLFPGSLSEERVNRNLQGYRRVSSALAAGADPRFLAEFQIVSVSVDSTKSKPALLMPFYLNLKNFSNLASVTEEKEFSKVLSEIVSLWKDVLRATIELHRHGLAHNDIKLGNILKTKDHYVLNDFDIVTDASDRSRKGSVTYLPPDTSVPPDASLDRDLYALAITLAELMTGRRYPVFEMWGNVGSIDALSNIKARLSEFQRDISPVLSRSYVRRNSKDRKDLEFLIRFIESFMQFHRGDRERSVLSLLNDERIDLSFRRILEPIGSLIPMNEVGNLGATLKRIFFQNKLGCREPISGK